MIFYPLDIFNHMVAAKNHEAAMILGRQLPILELPLVNGNLNEEHLRV